MTDRRTARSSCRAGFALLCGAALSLAGDWKPADSPLTTPCSDKVIAERAWPEYPRPQMVRANWTNINGLWDFAVRPKEAKQPTQFEGKLLVPFAVESALSGVKRAVTPEQRLWYRRTLTANTARGTRTLLHFGAVDWRAEVFVNGKVVGSHEGGYDPFSFDITRARKPGWRQQELVVGVWDPTDTGLRPRGKQVLAPGPNMFPIASDRISVPGEFGGLGLPLADHLWWDKRNWGYHTFDDRAKLQTAYDGLIEKLEPLVKQGLAAAIYTRITDVEEEVNGLMTYDRKVMKFDVARLAAMDHRLTGLVTR